MNRFCDFSNRPATAVAGKVVLASILLALLGRIDTEAPYLESAIAASHDEGIPVEGADHPAPAIRAAADLTRDRASDPRLTLAWIQTNLERIAAGTPPLRHDTEDHHSGLENIVDAYAHYLQGAPNLMDADLARVDAAAAAISQRLSTERPSTSTAGDSWWHRPVKPASYLAELDAILGTDAPDLLRFLVGLRKAAVMLFLEFLPEDFESSSELAASSGLALPCVTLIGRVEAVAQAKAALGSLADPLLACPTGVRALPVLESLALEPQGFSPKRPGEPAASPPEEPAQRPAPAPPWDHQSAIDHMAENPDAAEAALEVAAQSDDVGALDYALFLHAFRAASPERDEKIRALTDRLLGTAGPYIDSYYPVPEPYDGSDRSLADITEFASSALDVNTDSAFYAIPCDILVARPGLLEATRPRYGGNRDNFIPRSGCAWGRGQVRGFPSRSVDAFEDATPEADGDFLGSYGGSMRFFHWSERNFMRQQLRVDPAGLLGPVIAFDFPYQTWGDLGLDNRAVSRRIRDLYLTAKEELVAYNMRLGLNRDQAAQAAKTGLFNLAHGSTCGERKPAESTRGLLMDGAPLEQLAPKLAEGDSGEAVELKICSEKAGMDPLSHVAVAHQAALALLLDQGTPVDDANAFGKTPLMAAAQFDQIESAQLLLSRGAAVNAVTREKGGRRYLEHDGRSALMYAAASASLAMIELLLDAGADPRQADTRGARAVHYLLGYGPKTPANPKLNREERDRAIELLF